MVEKKLLGVMEKGSRQRTGHGVLRNQDRCVRYGGSVDIAAH